jgi:hypothetical protein
MFSKVFPVMTSTRAIEQFTQVSGVGLFSEIGEGEGVNYDQPIQGFDKTFRHRKWGNGFKATQELIEDEQWGLIRKTASDLALAGRESIEIEVWSDFNNAFDTNYTGPDGKALCVTDHPLVKAGGVQSNALSVAADLDVVSLQLLLTLYETMKSSTGRFIHVPAKNLVVAPANRWTAYELTKSGMRPDTANNAVNATAYAEDGMPVPLVVPYLTDPDAWFLTAPPAETGLVFFWRRKPYTKQWVEDPTETACTAVRYRLSHGWTDFYGVAGTPGA